MSTSRFPISIRSELTLVLPLVLNDYVGEEWGRRFLVTWSGHFCASEWLSPKYIQLILLPIPPLGGVTMGSSRSSVPLHPHRQVTKLANNVTKASH